ncbi:hypothetical protein K4F52_004423 [Lecanicillium sp. MT-2017a]|nr:hypothetical protein K4F52_004423 [Lecanicillium sp. MT-2017a]
MIGFPIARQDTALKAALQKYITERYPSEEAIAAVEHGCLWTDSIKRIILLLRGFMASGILSFIFSRRWRVDYGLDLLRQPQTRLAVPYRAKDVPKARSEFSQPDVVIALTYLTYYYGGLDKENLIEAFTSLAQSEEADAEYERWTAGIADMPQSLTCLDGVNLRDKEHFGKEIFPRLQYSKEAINYFLSQCVFPKEMKEFPLKFAASSWDLAHRSTHPVTGFSGTNDSQTVLPLQLEQSNGETHQHTNAKVLENVLSLSNSAVLMQTVFPSGQVSSTSFLGFLASQHESIRVLIDVGAQIIEYTNREVAQKWLTSVTDTDGVQAAVFCDESDELKVITRKGTVEPLKTSIFAKQLDVCLVFLDEAHSRGIDLRLPPNYKAAVTLGAYLTKDRLVQVAFYVNIEIERKIRTLKHLESGASIRVIDIVAWCVTETWSDERRAMSSWAIQGTRFDKHRQLWDTFAEKDDSVMNPDKVNKEWAMQFLEEEALTLEQRYKASLHKKDTQNIDFGNGPFATRIVERYTQFEGGTDPDTGLAEEQEREVAPEIHFERQIEEAGAPVPSKHSIHDALRIFVANGLIAESGAGFQWAFNSLLKITRESSHRNVLGYFPRDIRVTNDFAKVIRDDNAEDKDKYMRGVKYILIGQHSETDPLHIVVISPYEANELWQEINNSEHVTLHLYSPRQSLSSEPLDDFKLCTIPSGKQVPAVPERARISLNLFAGQLFFRSYAEYIAVCRYLGLAWFSTPPGLIVQPDGFVPRSSRERLPKEYLQNGEQWQKTFPSSPVAFLKVLMDRIRYKSGGIDKTHMGKLLGGMILTEEDFPQSRKRRADEISRGHEENQALAAQNAEGEDADMSVADGPTEVGEEDSLMFE